MKVGRPKTYSSLDERRIASNLRLKEKYISQKKDKKLKQNHPSYNMYCNAKKRAKEQGVPFDIYLEDIEIPSICPLLGILLIKGKGTYTDNSPTLDKIIPSLGYIKGNIQVISMRANRIKDNASFHEFEMIYNNWKKQRDSL